MNYELDEILFTEEQLRQTVSRLGKQITADYRGKNLLMIAVLKGSFVFMADLARQIDLPLAVDFMSVSSYGSGTKTSGNVNIIKDITVPLEDKDLLVVEDILDSGVTLAFLLRHFRERHPNSIRLCTLLDKPERRIADVHADYVGMSIEDKFIVGYGLDVDEKFRNLPYIATIKQ